MLPVGVLSRSRDKTELRRTVPGSGALGRASYSGRGAATRRSRAAISCIARGCAAKHAVLMVPKALRYVTFSKKMCILILKRQCWISILTAMMPPTGTGFFLYSYWLRCVQWRRIRPHADGRGITGSKRKYRFKTQFN